MIDKVIKKSNCMGCKMCGDLCPKKAISFETDNEGFWYPQVNYDTCISCNMCVAHCPVLNETTNKNSSNPDVYAAWVKDDEIRLKSTSGGIYYPFAQTILDMKGYIAGCVFSDDWKSAKHIAGNTQGDLEKIFRSKYFQSDTGGIYKKVKELLLVDKQVLFCGTPCQNAALIEFLGKDYENLVQVDFICRGINSPKAHEANVRELEKKYKSKVDFFNFKNKTRGWRSLGILVKFKNGKQDITFGSSNNAYIIAYNNSADNFCMRPSCANCRFKKIPRVSDISIGDFWGIRHRNPEDLHKGISCVMLNTNKGKHFYEKVLPKLHSESHSFEEMSKGNTNIYTCAKYGSDEKRAEFFHRIEVEDFSNVVWDMLGVSKRKLWIKGKKDILKGFVRKCLNR